ncbi:MAG: phage terminase large subunit family protein [Nitrospira sp.]|nr:phage terminase large subunit family protein [Nitrospira sp.]
MRLVMPQISYANPELLAQDFWAALQPDPDETVSEWSDTFMRLPSEAPFPGKWRTDRFPFMREIMDCLSPANPAREVIFMKPNQISGTSTAVNWAGYTIHRSPCNFLFVEPTVELGKRLTKHRLDPMIDLVPEVHSRVRAARARDSGNTTFEKEFIGGRIVITGANSGVGLRFMSAARVVMDEADGYPSNVDKEGSVPAVVRRRVSAFKRYKIFILSTPKIKETSIIEPEYLDSDQCRYYVPCPFCDHGQTLTWEGLDWKNGQPETAAYLCEQCHQRIPEYHKTDMLARGEWRSTLGTTQPSTLFSEEPTDEERQRLAQLSVGDWTAVLTSRQKRGFHLNILYQPLGMVEEWPYLAKEWMRITHTKDREALQTFVNTYWAETWEEELGEKLDYKDLWNRREIYASPVPRQVKVITAFVDVQRDRLEAEARGFGPGKENWGLGLRVFLGSPTDFTIEGPWARVDQWLHQCFDHPELGPMRIALAGVDSGDGLYVKEVYDFVRPRQGRGVVATKGSSQPKAHLLAGRTKHRETGIWIYSIGTDAAKDSIYANLKLTEPGPGVFHWPCQHIGYDEEYFQQVCAEVKVPVKARGRVVGTRYMKLRDRNEGLDLLVGNWFIVEHAGVDLNQYVFDYREPQPNAQQRTQQAERSASWIRGSRSAGRGSSGQRHSAGWLRR